MPNTPQSHRKNLKVIPHLIKNKEPAEYLVDNSKKPFATMTTMHVAELLAEIPWTTTRARQHVVNKIAHTLHKVLIFNSQLTSPFKK